MKRQWRIRRHFQAATDGTQRWDHAYQHLLEWARQPFPGNGARLPGLQPSPAQEEDYEHGDLCPRVHRAADPSPNH
jgi:hypothetical protein